jgi:hypothetical protein
VLSTWFKPYNLIPDNGGSVFLQNAGNTLPTPKRRMKINNEWLGTLKNSYCKPCITHIFILKFCTRQCSFIFPYTHTMGWCTSYIIINVLITYYQSTKEPNVTVRTPGQSQCKRCAYFPTYSIVLRPWSREVKVGCSMKELQSLNTIFILECIATVCSRASRRNRAKLQT